MEEEHSFLFNRVFRNLKLSGPCEEIADWQKLDSLAGWMEPRLGIYREQEQTQALRLNPFYRFPPNGKHAT